MENFINALSLKDPRLERTFSGKKEGCNVDVTVLQFQSTVISLLGDELLKVCHTYGNHLTDEGNFLVDGQTYHQVVYVEIFKDSDRKDLRGVISIGILGDSDSVNVNDVLGVYVTDDSKEIVCQSYPGVSWRNSLKEFVQKIN